MSEFKERVRVLLSHPALDGDPVAVEKPIPVAMIAELESDLRAALDSIRQYRHKVEHDLTYGADPHAEPTNDVSHAERLSMAIADFSEYADQLSTLY